jgi:hypothetical protein
MADDINDTAERLAAWARTLPDNAELAAAAALAFGALIAIRSGLSDAEATGSLEQALRELRGRVFLEKH